MSVERRTHGSEGGVGSSSREAVRAYPTAKEGGCPAFLAVDRQLYHNRYQNMSLQASRTVGFPPAHMKPPLFEVVLRGFERCEIGRVPAVIFELPELND